MSKQTERPKEKVKEIHIDTETDIFAHLENK